MLSNMHFLAFIRFCDASYEQFFHSCHFKGKCWPKMLFVYWFQHDMHICVYKNIQIENNVWVIFLCWLPCQRCGCLRLSHSQKKTRPINRTIFFHYRPNKKILLLTFLFLYFLSRWPVNSYDLFILFFSQP